MFPKKQIRHFLSILLALVLTVIALPHSLSAAILGSSGESKEEAAARARLENTTGDLPADKLHSAVLAEKDILEQIPLEQVSQADHANRLRAQEQSLAEAVYQNRDGTKTQYLFGEDVKFVDATGEVKDKSNQLHYARYNGAYGYTNPDRCARIFPGADHVQRPRGGHVGA